MESHRRLSRLKKQDRLLIQSAIESIDNDDVDRMRGYLGDLIQRKLLDYQKAYPLDRTLLLHSLRKMKARIATLLLDAGSNISLSDCKRVTPLMKAAQFDLGLTRRLLDMGSDVHARDCHGLTALHHASGSILADVRILRDLVKSGADVNGAENAGRTPLHKAAALVDPVKIRCLLNQGADPTLEAKGTQGTPLRYLMETVQRRPRLSPKRWQECVSLLSS